MSKGSLHTFIAVYGVLTAQNTSITLDKSPCKLLDVQTSSLARKIKENSLIDAI